MEPKIDQIKSKQRHLHVGNHRRINNLTSIHFDYHLNIMICQDEFLFKIKTLGLKTI
jgi:hypothetical protein